MTLQPFFQYIIFHPTFHHQPNGAEKALAAIYWTILKYIYVLNQNNCTFIKYKWLYFSENLSSCQKCNLNKSTRKVFILEVWGATSLMEADLIFSHHTLECKISYKSLLNISIFGCFFPSSDRWNEVVELRDQHKSLKLTHSSSPLHWQMEHFYITIKNLIFMFFSFCHILRSKPSHNIYI